MSVLKENDQLLLAKSKAVVLIYPNDSSGRLRTLGLARAVYMWELWRIQGK
jgi:hypothetical protein